MPFRSDGLTDDEAENLCRPPIRARLNQSDELRLDYSSSGIEARIRDIEARLARIEQRIKEAEGLG